MLQKNNKETLFNKNVFEILKLLFNFPNKIFHIRDIAKRTNCSTTAVTTTINKLTKLNIINLEKTTITTNIQANLESENFTQLKKIFNLYLLEKIGIIQTIKKEMQPETIVLFGSYSKGEDIEKSDIDILIISSRKISEKVEKLSKKSEKELYRKINFYVLNNLNKSSPEFKNAIANGVVLYGYIKLL